jgi:threonine dehydrogenase-like Zn-dependent dehydrogenase
MRAAQLKAPEQPRLVEVEQATPGPGEVLVKVLACGLCGSDLNAWRGVPGTNYPLAPGRPGHEVWGEVASIGPDVGGFAPSQKVTGLLQAGYAQYALARADELLRVPASFGDRPLLGEPLACAANVVRRMRWQPSDRLAVVGFGYLAALVLRLLFPTSTGSWVVVTRRPESRALALQLGAEAAYGFADVPAACWDSFPIVLEAAGVQQSLDYATWLTAYGGRLVIAGYHADGPRTVNLQSWNWKGIDVVNAHEREPAVYLRGLREGLQIVERHGLDLTSLITHHWPLDQIDQAFRTAVDRPPEYVKGAVLPWSE